MRLWLDRGQICFTPDPVDGGFDLGLKTRDQLPVGIDQRLLGFDFGDDGALGFEVGNGDSKFAKYTKRNRLLRNSGRSLFRLLRNLSRSQ